MGSAVRPDTGGPDAQGAPTSVPRILSPDEFTHAKTLSAPQLARAQFPTIPPTFAPKESTRVGPTDPNPSAHQLTGAGKVASDVFSMGASAVENIPATAAGILTAPVIALWHGAKANAELGQREYLATHGRNPDEQPISGTKTEGIGDVAQLIATVGAGPAEQWLGEKLLPLVGLHGAATLSKVLVSSGVGAAYSPDKPAAGAVVGSLFGMLHAHIAGDAGAGKLLQGAVDEHVQRINDAWNQIVDPAARSPEAGQAAGILRATTGEMAAKYEQAAFQLDGFRRAINPLSDAEKLSFIDAIEGGKGQSVPELQPVADAMRKILDDGRAQVQGLGTGKLEHFIKDYFPHIWEDPERAATAFEADTPLDAAKIAAGGKRPMEGSKAFLKQRTIPTIKEGMDMGLVPVTTNPIDLTLLKLREMQRYVMAHQSLNELKDAGLAKFVSAGDQAPDGYAKINDKIATVFGPRQGAVTLPEGASTVTPGEPTPMLNGEPLRNADLPEHVIAAAVKSKDGRVFVGNMHAEATDASGGVIPQQGGPKSVGFVTNKGQFLTRSQAAKYAAPDVVARLKRSGDVSLDAADFQKFKFGVKPGEVTMQQAPDAEAKVAPMDPNDVGVTGMRIMGEHYAPEPVARLVNNYLSPGLRGNALYDAYRGLGNTLNQAQLGFSAFHLGMTSLDASVSRTALGLEYLKSGDTMEGLRQIATSPTAALPGIMNGLTDYIDSKFDTHFSDRLPRGLGARIRDAYLDPENAPPEMQALANAVKEAGGRVRQDSFYQNSAPQKMIDSWKSGEYGKAAAYSLPAALETAAQPLMEHIVPMQKLQVFGEMAQKVLADLPEDASLAERRAALGDAWNSVDNRMGQLVYDNLFWNKTFKDLAMGGVRSVGWNLGTIRELGGGTMDVAKMGADAMHGDPVKLTHAAAYAIALPLQLAMYGAAYQYLRTGQGPQEMKDYYFPKTGEVDADGNGQRVQLPSYMKDFFAYEGHPFETIKHKMSPLLAGMYEMLNNQDYYGDEIRNPNDPVVQQLQQEAKFVAKQTVPFSVQGMFEDTKRGDDSKATKFGNWFGITPAPRDKVRSDAQNTMADYLNESHSTGVTPEAADARRTRAALLSSLRDRVNGKGDPKELEQRVTEALTAHQIVPADIGKLLKRAGSSPAQERFKLLSLPQAIDVFKQATPDEQAKFGELLLKKLERVRE